jgi:hypothetical protein
MARWTAGLPMSLPTAKRRLDNAGGGAVTSATISIRYAQ